MSWNYRVISKGERFAIHEVYYDEDGSPESCTVFPCYPYGENFQEFLEELERYYHAMSLPVLLWQDFDKQGE